MEGKSYSVRGGTSKIVVKYDWGHILTPDIEYFQFFFDNQSKD